MRRLSLIALFALACAACTSLLGDFTVGSVPPTGDGGSPDAPVSETGRPDAPSTPPFADAIEVSAGASHTCALRGATKTIACWGSNARGQLGVTGADSPVPVTVIGMSNAIAVSSGARHTCAIDTNHTAWCWGTNENGQLGTGNLDGAPHPRPSQVVSDADAGGPLTGIVSISAGESHTCAVASTGAAYCWGSNGSGQLGVALTVTSTGIPIETQGGAGMQTIAAGTTYTCGTFRDASNTILAQCWGKETSGQLGDNKGANTQTVPTGVVFASGLTPQPPTGTATGSSHSCMVDRAGIAYCWGDNGFGELGTHAASGGNAASNVGVSVAGLDTGRTAQVAVGNQFTCAALSDGTVACLGSNAALQLGSGTADANPHPQVTPVPGVTGAKAITARANHACALVGNGGIVCWGGNVNGEVGNGTTGTTSPPVVVVAPAS